MSSSRISRTITRIAYQIYEDTHGVGEPVIFGIDDRGFKLAGMLSDRLSEIYQTPIRAHVVRVMTDSSQENQSNYGSEPFPTVKNKKVVIVDDVLYSGKTMYHALQLIANQDGPEEIKLAALIDRGHRRYPVNIQYLGLYCPTKLKEHVQCRFLENGEPDGVWLEH